jgi:hypothetical protein
MAGGGAAAAAGAASWKAASIAAAGKSDETTEISGLRVGDDPQSNAVGILANDSEDMQLNARRQALILHFFLDIFRFSAVFRLD